MVETLTLSFQTDLECFFKTVKVLVSHSQKKSSDKLVVDSFVWNVLFLMRDQELESEQSPDRLLAVWKMLVAILGNITLCRGALRRPPPMFNFL